MTLLVGADGCSEGWLCVIASGGQIHAAIVSDIRALLAQASSPAIVAIDVPIGLPDRGARACDLEARTRLRRPRRSSVFPAPVRASLPAASFLEAGQLHRKADGRGLTKQAYAIFPKIREVDAQMQAIALLQDWVMEVHPEVCFAVWNQGLPMRHKKSTVAGRTEREALIELEWPGLRPRLAASLRGHRWHQDDLNDALAALWTATRIAQGTAVRLPAIPERDSLGIRMEMWA